MSSGSFLLQVVFAILYVFAQAGILWLGTKYQHAVIDAVTSVGNVGWQSVRLWVWSVAILTSSFATYWLLTGIFPIIMILVLFVVSFLGTGLYLLAGAIIGFGVPQKQEKISLLSLLFAASGSPLAALLINLASLVLYLASAVACLVIFFLHPRGHTDSVILISIVHFVVPSLLSMALISALTWPTVTSPYIDDDLRNSHIVSMFHVFIRVTILMFFPFYLLQQYPGTLNFSMPPAWIVLSAPSLVFLFGSVLPFFIGVYRFRAQTRSMLQWRRRWIDEMGKALKFPKELRADEKKRLLDELEHEIRNGFAANKLFQFFQKLVSNELQAGYESRAIEADSSGNAMSAPLLITAPQTQEPSIPTAPSRETTSTIRQDIATAKMALRDPIKARRMFTADRAEQIRIAILENKHKLPEWDIRFEHLWKILNLYEYCERLKERDLAKHLSTVVTDMTQVEQQFESTGHRGNLISAAMTGIVSSAAAWTFGVFQDDIGEGIKFLVGLI